MLLVLFWMLEFGGVLVEHKEELMSVSRGGEENVAVMVTGGGSVWTKWARRHSQCGGETNLLDFLIDREGSMVWP